MNGNARELKVVRQDSYSPITYRLLESHHRVAWVAWNNIRHDYDVVEYITGNLTKDEAEQYLVDMKEGL